MDFIEANIRLDNIVNKLKEFDFEDINIIYKEIDNFISDIGASSFVKDRVDRFQKHIDEYAEWLEKYYDAKNDVIIDEEINSIVENIQPKKIFQYQKNDQIINELYEINDILGELRIEFSKSKLSHFAKFGESMYIDTKTSERIRDLKKKFEDNINNKQMVEVINSCKCFYEFNQMLKSDICLGYNIKQLIRILKIIKKEYFPTCNFEEKVTPKKLEYRTLNEDDELKIIKQIARHYNLNDTEFKVLEKIYIHGHKGTKIAEELNLASQSVYNITNKLKETFLSKVEIKEEEKTKLKINAICKMIVKKYIENPVDFE